MPFNNHHQHNHNPALDKTRQAVESTVPSQERIRNQREYHRAISRITELELIIAAEEQKIIDYFARRRETHLDSAHPALSP